MLKTESHNVHTYYKQGCSEQLEQILLHCNNSSELLHLSFFSKDNQVNLRQTSQCLKAPAFPGACQEYTDFPCSISIDNYSVQPLNPSKTSGCCSQPPPSSLDRIKLMFGEVNPLVPSHIVLQPFWALQPLIQLGFSFLAVTKPGLRLTPHHPPVQLPQQEQSQQPSGAEVLHNLQLSNSADMYK